MLGSSCEGTCSECIVSIPKSQVGLVGEPSDDELSWLQQSRHYSSEYALSPTAYLRVLASTHIRGSMRASRSFPAGPIGCMCSTLYRLSCQIVMSKELDGITVQVPVSTEHYVP